MSKAMDCLIYMENVLQDMQNIERKIGKIDSGVRNRAFTVRELMEERELENEKNEKRKQLNELKEKLANFLKDEKQVKDLKDEFSKKYGKSSNSELKKQYGLFKEWIIEAWSEDINVKKDADYGER